MVLNSEGKCKFGIESTAISPSKNSQAADFQLPLLNGRGRMSTFFHRAVWFCAQSQDARETLGEVFIMKLYIKSIFFKVHIPEDA